MHIISHNTGRVEKCSECHSRLVSMKHKHSHVYDMLVEALTACNCCETCADRVSNANGELALDESATTAFPPTQHRHAALRGKFWPPELAAAAAAALSPPEAAAAAAAALES